MNLEINNEGRVRRIALDRPAQRNQLNVEMAQELIDALAAAQADEGIRSILLEGRGEVFCCGGDPDLPPSLWNLALTKPLITAIRGAALGAGLALVAQSHVAIAAQGSSFGILDIRNKIYPASLPSVAPAIGWRRATELALSGRVCSTPEALQMGLITEIAPAFEYEERAEAMAQLLAEADEAAVRRILSSRFSS